MPRNIGPRPLPDPQFDLHRRRQCRRACDPHRPAPQTDARLAEVYAARSGRTPEEFTLLMAENNGSGRWLSPQEALAAGLVDRIIEPAATEKRLRHRRRRPDNGASCSASWDSSVRQTPFPPTATSSISATRKKGPAPALRNSPCTKASNSRLRPARSPAKIRRSEKRLPRPTSGPMPKMQSN